MEFAELTKDPFVNNTNKYFLVLDIQNRNTPNNTSVGGGSVTQGIIKDSQGNAVGYYWFSGSWDYTIVGSLSDEAFAHSYISKREWALVPPNFSFSNFGMCIGFWLSTREVEQFILGRLSLKGGD